MSELVRLVYSTLVGDVIDTSPSNPSLLTLANRAPQRIGSGELVPVTLVGAAGAPAGVTTFEALDASELEPGQQIWIGGPQPETVIVAASGTTGSNVNLTSPLLYSHGASAVISGLPSIITQTEPRTPLNVQADYWRIVLGPYREWPETNLVQRAPTRLYEAMLNVKVYDSSPSRKLAEDVLDRIDWLLNLGETGSNATPASLFGPSPRIFIESAKLGSGPDPISEPATQVTQHVQTYHFGFSKRYT